MALIFCDSFNHYGPILAPPSKWDFPFGGVIIQNAAIARSGDRVLQITAGGAAGPQKNIGTGLQVVQYRKLILGVALNIDPIPALQSNDIFHFEFEIQGQQTPNIIVQLNADGSFSVFRGPGDSPLKTLLGTSAAGLFQFNPNPTTTGLWNYLEAKVFVDGVVGSVELRLAPPTGPMSVILSLTNQNTAAFVAFPYTNQLHLDGPGALNQHCYCSDFYCVDWSDGSDYLGGVRIYRDLPFANGSPVQFTPLAGTNWQMVNDVPPDNDTSYNSSGVVGQVDQYQHDITPLPVGSQIKAVQHVIDAKTDSGARAITSVVGGVVNPNTVYLSNGYSMFTFPYDNNPVTGKPWVISDFPAQFGPKVVA